MLGICRCAGAVVAKKGSPADRCLSLAIDAIQIGSDRERFFARVGKVAVRLARFAPDMPRATRSFGWLFGELVVHRLAVAHDDAREVAEHHIAASVERDGRIVHATRVVRAARPYLPAFGRHLS